MMRQVIIIFLVLMPFAVSARHTWNYEALAMFKKENSNNISDEILELMHLDTPGLINRFGYPVEVHKATTLDGYILEMHRIPHGKVNYTRPGNKSVVFLMHGLLSSSADYVVLGPGVSLALLLADEGYDVWLGNARGNYYSRNHVSLNPDMDSRFWLFSWDEIGHIDLPTCIDYILNLTGEKTLHYIGHSQGGTAFLVLNSLRPEYNKKIQSFHGLAPSSYNTYNPYVRLRFLTDLTIFIEKNVEQFGPFESFNNQQSQIMASFLLCNGADINDPSCISNIMTLQTAIPELQNLNTTLIPLFFSNSPAGASIMQGLHYAQVTRTDTFARYNFNNVTNLHKYGSVNPPEYEISKITAPSCIYYSMNDHLVYWKDIRKLAKRLPNLKQLYKVKEMNFNHVDYTFRSDVKPLLYDKVIENIRNMH